MYGHWTHCEPKVCEFQHGTTMIYVSYNDARPMQSRLAVAQKTIAAAFSEAEFALDFARHVSEITNPEFWQYMRRITPKQNPLIIFAIRYPLDSDQPIYEISWNPIFEPELGASTPEEWMEEQVLVENLPNNGEVIYVKRLGAQLYAQAT
jgi:hypothetical protein